MDKYDVKYFLCGNCGFVFTEEPYWLNEAYKSAINISDTGIVTRKNLSTTPAAMEFSHDL